MKVSIASVHANGTFGKIVRLLKDSSSSRRWSKTLDCMVDEIIPEHCTYYSTLIVYQKKHLEIYI